jgi:hypothetical protein
MKHHYGEWSTDRSTLGGLALVSIQDREHFTHCTRCGVMVKIGRVGGYKFWVDGKWSKRPECRPKK